MTIETAPIYFPQGLEIDRSVLQVLQTMADRIDKPRVETVAQLGTVSFTVSNPPTQAEVIAIANAVVENRNKLNELIVAFINAVIMEAP